MLNKEMSVKMPVDTVCCSQEKGFLFIKAVLHDHTSDSFKLARQGNVILNSLSAPVTETKMLGSLGAGESLVEPSTSNKTPLR